MVFYKIRFMCLKTLGSNTKCLKTLGYNKKCLKTLGYNTRGIAVR